MAWPDRWEHQSISSSLADIAAAEIVYERARADAAMVRLRVAVEALQHYRHWLIVNHYPEFSTSSPAMEALKAIGELPGQ